MLYSNRHNFHLDPAPDGAAGGAANPGSPVGGDAAPAFDASQYVPKSEFETIQNDYREFRQTAEQRFQDYDSRLPKPEPVKAKADEAPRKEDFDFSKDGEFERFMDERAKYNFRQQRKEWETEQSQTQTKKEYDDSVKAAISSHGERMDAYKATNPDYDPFKNVNIPHDGVTLEILNSDYSAHIHHYLQKNPEKLKELRGLSQSNPASAVRMVGRIEAMFEQKAAPVVPLGKPTRSAFGAGSAKPAARDPLEVVKEWRN